MLIPNRQGQVYSRKRKEIQGEASNEQLIASPLFTPGSPTNLPTPARSIPEGSLVAFFTSFHL